MSPWHLVWIIPGSATFGAFLAALLAANREDDDE